MEPTHTITEKKAAATRERLLQAACRVLITVGVNHLTLEAVAAEAKVSKGGLLYHFPSKERLIQGIVRSLIDSFFARIEVELGRAAEPPTTPGRWLRAYIRATFDVAPDEYELSAALGVVLGAEPAMLDFARASFNQMAALALNDGLDPTQATLIRLATDGLWFNEVLQLAPMDTNARRQLFDRLMAFTRKG